VSLGIALKKGVQMDIGDLWRFGEEKFGLKKMLREIRDNRERPQIPLATALGSVMDMVALGQKSLLEVDQDGRRPGAKAWHGSKRRMVVSDSTLERVLESVDLSDVRKMLHSAVRRAGADGDLKVMLPSGRKVCAGIVDSSDFGGVEGCVFAIAGVAAAPVDIKTHSKGKELIASRLLLSEVRRTFGKGCVDVTIGDGLYISKHHIRQCKEELFCDAVVKTSEETLAIIQNAKGLFSLPPEPHDGIERLAGVDVNRGVKYRIIAARGFDWIGLPYEFKVAKVEEEKIKPKPGEEKFETFWVITTDVDMSGLDMRELAHMRWVIENNVFKRLSELVGSKRGWIRNKRVKEALLLLWFIGLLLLGYYLVSHGFAMLRKVYGAVKATWKYVTRIFRCSLEKFSMAKA